MSEPHFYSTYTNLWEITGAHRFFLLEGGGADLEATYNTCLILKTVMKTTSKSPSRHVVWLQGKLKLKKIILPSFCYIFQYCNVSSADFSG